jgi:hypothetical protein
MYPGYDYTFPGAKWVKEIPLKWKKKKRNLKILK